MSYEFIDMKIGHHLLALPLYIFWSMVMQKKIQPVCIKQNCQCVCSNVLPIWCVSKVSQYHILALASVSLARYDSRSVLTPHVTPSVSPALSVIHNAENDPKLPPCPAHF